MANETTTIPERSDVREGDQWNLAGLYPGDAEWEAELKEFERKLPKIEGFRGRLGESAATLREAFDFNNELGLIEERLGSYAQLRLSENAGDSRNQDRVARYVAVASRGEALSSYQTPELQSIPEPTMEGFLRDPLLKDFVIRLRRILRYKPHVLTADEERLLAMQIESSQTPSKAFGALTDVDLEFGSIETPEGSRPLSQSSYSSFQINQDREIRKTAYFQFYAGFERHKNTLAALYAGSVHQDIYRARVRRFNSAREGALFPDDIPTSVYDNLVGTIERNLDKLHRYYELRRRVLGVDKLHLYDVYVPLVKSVDVRHTYDQAVDLVIPALAPLGKEYCETLRAGLLGGWVDRYENKGKRSGAFSAGSFVGDPYILMNYKDDVLRDVFTLAHEGGHSMHSWYSVRSNPFQHYSYTIFEAEVASTFNEELVGKYLLDRADSVAMKAYLIGKEVDDIIATIFRQTMFAEFERSTHAMIEAGGALTVDSLRETYRALLTKYFGERIGLEEVSDLEGLRIPHFYHSFYVYKYATGLSAAIALSRRVLEGGAAERDAYLSFLKSGGSRFPIESLKLAGVDMSTAAPIESAMSVFEEKVRELERIL